MIVLVFQSNFNFIFFVSFKILSIAYLIMLYSIYKNTNKTAMII